jgi:hypothetical protein
VEIFEIFTGFVKGCEDDSEVVAVAGEDVDVTQNRNVMQAINRETGFLTLLNIACLRN